MTRRVRAQPGRPCVRSVALAVLVPGVARASGAVPHDLAALEQHTAALQAELRALLLSGGTLVGERGARPGHPARPARRRHWRIQRHAPRRRLSRAGFSALPQNACAWSATRPTTTDPALRAPTRGVRGFAAARRRHRRTASTPAACWKATRAEGRARSQADRAAQRRARDHGVRARDADDQRVIEFDATLDPTPLLAKLALCSCTLAARSRLCCSESPTSAGPRRTAVSTLTVPRAPAACPVRATAPVQRLRQSHGLEFTVDTLAINAPRARRGGTRPPAQSDPTKTTLKCSSTETSLRARAASSSAHCGRAVAVHGTEMQCRRGVGARRGHARSAGASAPSSEASLRPEPPRQTKVNSRDYALPTCGRSG